MRILRLIVISFIVFSLMAACFSLLIPSHIHISKAINIKADRDSIMAMVKNPDRWKQWYPGLDTAKPLYIEGKVQGMIIRGEEIFKQTYIQITAIDSNQVTAQLVSQKLRPVTNVWSTIGYSSGDSITLHWYMDFHLHWYPWEKFGSLLLEKSYGPLMEKGLSNLKKDLEN